MHIGSQITELGAVPRCLPADARAGAALRADGHRDPTISTSAAASACPIAAATTSPPLAARVCARSSSETLGDLGLKLVLEPGRMIVGNAGILVTRVHLRQGGRDKTFTIVDAAMNDLIRPTLYEA